jgi:hypothetical protein
MCYFSDVGFVLARRIRAVQLRMYAMRMHAVSIFVSQNLQGKCLVCGAFRTRLP